MTEKNERACLADVESGRVGKEPILVILVAGTGKMPKETKQPTH